MPNSKPNRAASQIPQGSHSKADKAEGTAPKQRSPQKCRRCATLSAQQAKALHGVEGDGCWNSAVCPSRRFYARNRDRINQTRSRKRKEGQLEAINVEFEPLTSIVFAVLVVYRAAGVDTPVHAIAAEIWQGQEKIAIVPRFTVQDSSRLKSINM